MQVQVEILNKVLHLGRNEPETWGLGGFDFGCQRIVRYKLGIGENLTA